MITRWEQRGGAATREKEENEGWHKDCMRRSVRRSDATTKERIVKKIWQTVRREVKRFLAPWAAQDEYGTWQPCWTEGEAMGWLPYLAHDARVVKGWRRGVVVARRVQTN
jgi:hypothetical protein